MPSHPDRVRRNYEERWWEKEPYVPTPEPKPDYTGPAIAMTAFYLMCLVLVGYYVLTGWSR